MGQGLVINSNIPAFNTSRVLRGSTAALNRSLERLSSGLRINRARDDAAGLAVAENLRARVRGLDVAGRNAQDGISLVQTAEGALSETANILQRMRELAVQSANGTLSDNPNRNDLQVEITQLIAQIDAIAGQTEFNNIVLLNGSVASVALQVGADAGQTLTVTLQNATAATLGVAGVSVATAGGASAAITTIDTAFNTLNTARATLGAAQNRLEFTINTLAIQQENAAASESAIRDADIARETIAFTRNQILVAAGTSVLAQANIVPQTALQLLG